MKPRYEVVYGGLGSGKSDFILEHIDPERVFKLGLGNWLLEILALRPGAVRRHERENKKRGIESKSSTLGNIVHDITEVISPELLIDDWTTLYRYAPFWSYERISQKCSEIFGVINSNPNLEKAMFICWDAQTLRPFSLYKKRALWNRELFRVADRITKIEYGVPLLIKDG